MKFFSRRILYIILGLAGSFQLLAQVSSRVTNEERYGEYMDSIQAIDYPYILPFYGDQVRDAGYDLPKPAGVMLGFYTQNQDVLLEDLHVGFNGELVDISDLVVFSSINTSNNVFTFRPDVWILPFMNIYAIVNRFEAITDVVVQEPIELTVPTVTTSGYGGGFGSTLAYGWGPVWASANANLVWSTTPILNTPTRSISSAVRVGTQLYNKKRTQHISVWVGMGYQSYTGQNGGTYDMSQLIPDDGLEDLQDQIQEILDGLQEGYEDWCNTPGNGPACAVLTPILEELGDRVQDKIDGLEPTPLVIGYEFNSSPAKKVSMVAGAQYSYKKRWDFRTEFGFLGRRSFLVNVNYRFGIIKKKS